MITYPLNGITYDASDAETYLCTRTSGLFDDDADFALEITGAREVTIGTGLAWIRSEDFSGKSVANKEEVALSVDLADGALNRIDRVIIKFDKANRISTIEILKGTAAASAVAPALTRTADIYMLGLYEISVPAGSTTITSANITDTRSDPAVCGRMSDGVSGVNTLQAQIDRMSYVRTVTLLANGWSSSAPYTQTVNDGVMTSESEFDYYLDGDPTSAQKEGYGYIGSANGGNGTITFKCPDDKPTADLVIKVKGY